jgi:anti-anti-sigma factor
MMFEKAEPFEIREEPTGATALTMRLYGEFDVACREGFQAAVERVSQNGLRELVIDLAGLTFVDSSGIRSLLEAKRWADQGGLLLFVTLPLDGQVRKTLELAGVDQAL